MKRDRAAVEELAAGDAELLRDRGDVRRGQRRVADRARARCDGSARRSMAARSTSLPVSGSVGAPGGVGCGRRACVSRDSTPVRRAACRGGATRSRTATAAEQHRRR